MHPVILRAIPSMKVLATQTLRQLRARAGFILLALAGGGLITPFAAAAPVFPYPYTKEILPNGLTIIVIPMESPGQVAYLLRRAHRQPRRGRGGQVGLRPFLRAHDVSGHEEISPRRV